MRNAVIHVRTVRPWLSITIVVSRQFVDPQRDPFRVEYEVRGDRTPAPGFELLKGNIYLVSVFDRNKECNVRRSICNVAN